MASSNKSSCYHDPIMVIGINEPNFDEISTIIGYLDNPQNEMIENIKFIKGEINHFPVVIAITALRRAAAKLVTTIAYQHFHPKYIINVGSSGGHHKKLHINDIILGKNIIDIDEYNGIPSIPSTWILKKEIRHDDPYLLKIANNINYSHGKIKLGTIATSDNWNTDITFINKIHNKFNEDCEEMESYAISEVADKYLVPHLNIRIISNNATNNEKYDKNASKYAQVFTYELLIRLTK